MGKLIGTLGGGSPDASVALGSPGGSGLTNTRTFRGAPGVDLSQAQAPATFAASADPNAPPEMSAPTGGLPTVGAQPQVSNTPSFLAALNSGPAGMSNALSPGLNTKGKVLAMILSAAKGGLAGWAAGQEGNPRTGYGGAAAGFQAASQLPFIQAMQRQQIQQGQMQQQVEAAQLQNLPNVRAQQQATLENTQAEAFKNRAQGNKALQPISSKEGTPEQQYLDSLTQQTNPQTGRPYTIPEAYVKMKQDAQDTKPDPNGPPLEQQLDKAIASGDTPRAQQILGELHAKAQATHIVDPAAAAARGDARNDRSYQYNASRLDKLRTPIEQSLDRLTRAQQNVSAGTPQADALVAPELLSVMAGGQGSGLRMNEAEISRMVGGRSNWESLKAAANKWQTDPSKALSITPSQRGQISQIIALEKSRLGAKQDVIDEEGNNLLNANDVKDHRTIVNRAQKRLGEIDAGGGGTGQVMMRAPNGQTRAVSPDQVEHYKSLGATVTQ